MRHRYLGIDRNAAESKTMCLRIPRDQNNLPATRPRETIGQYRNTNAKRIHPFRGVPAVAIIYELSVLSRRTNDRQEYHFKAGVFNSCSSWDIRSGTLEVPPSSSVEGWPTTPFFRARRESDFSQSIECACDWILTAIAMGCDSPPSTTGDGLGSLPGGQIEHNVRARTCG